MASTVTLLHIHWVAMAVATLLLTSPYSCSASRRLLDLEMGSAVQLGSDSPSLHQPTSIPPPRNTETSTVSSMLPKLQPINTETPTRNTEMPTASSMLPTLPSFQVPALTIPTPGCSEVGCKEVTKLTPLLPFPSWPVLPDFPPFPFTPTTPSFPLTPGFRNGGFPSSPSQGEKTP